MRTDSIATVEEFRPEVSTVPLGSGLDEELSEVLEGLSRPQKRLPCKHFYDRTGTKLFEQITQLPEYYLTRIETAILRRHAGEMADLVGEECRLVEFGSGSSTKTRLLLDALRRPVCYVPIDISKDALLPAAEAIAAAYPQIVVQPVISDYTRKLELPDPPPFVAATCAFFPGSTLGNFDRREALWFLRRVRGLAGEDGNFIVGIDLRKDPGIIERAYNDAGGLTAAFNANILNVINRRFDADFDPGQFWHEAVYDAPAGSLEMRLVSRRDQIVQVADHSFCIADGEHIVTELSYKYTIPEFAALVGDAGWRLIRVWQDPLELFAVCCLRPARPRAAESGEPRALSSRSLANDG